MFTGTLPPIQFNSLSAIYPWLTDTNNISNIENLIVSNSVSEILKDGRQDARNVWNDLTMPTITAYSGAVIGVLLVILIVKNLRG